MKNNNILLLLFLGLFITLNSCQKDYPKDIPKWLKEKIKEREKVCKKEGCFCKSSGIGCWTIFEWDEEGVVYYVKDGGFIDVSDLIYVEVYDINGVVLCSSWYNRMGVNHSIDGCKIACPDLLKNGNVTRNIWIEDYTK